MLVICSWHISSLGSPQVFCGHPIHPEFVPDGVVSRGVWEQAAAEQAGGLQAGWDPPRTDQFWGCRTSICMPGTCLMLMVLDPSLFSRFCFSSTDLAEIAKKGMWDTEILLTGSTACSAAVQCSLGPVSLSGHFCVGSSRDIFNLCPRFDWLILQKLQTVATLRFYHGCFNSPIILLSPSSWAISFV